MTKPWTFDSLRDTFVIVSIFSKSLTSALFVFLLYKIYQRRDAAFQGDEQAAKRLILPCYKPLLRYLALLFFGFALAHSCTFIFERTSLSRYRFIQLASFYILSVYTIPQLLLVQRSVSAKSFFNTAKVLVPLAVATSVIWGLEVRTSGLVYEIVFCLISTLGFITFSAGLLSGKIPSRIQLKSVSNRSVVDFSLVYAVAFLISNIIGLVFRNSEQVLDNLTIAISLLMNIMSIFFPFALYRTLLADTKYWRGLGRHNRGGIKFNDAIMAGHVPEPSIDIGVASEQLQDMLAEHESVVLDFAYLQVGNLIGKGATSDVYFGMLKQEAVAIKVFTPPEVTEEEVRTIAAEAALTKSLQHPNIVHLYGICVRPPQVAMVLELCTGNLKDVLKNPKEIWTTWRKFEAAIDCCLAVEFLHSKSIIHRDIKADNFFVDENGVVKLGDFGESTLKKKAEYANRRMTILGSVSHMAPELIKASASYTEKVDIYSLGITLWEIWTGKNPYANLNTFQVYKHVAESELRLEVPQDCDAAFVKVMMNAWGQDSTVRPTAREMAEGLQDGLDVFMRSTEYKQECMQAGVPSLIRPRRRKTERRPTMNAVVSPLKNDDDEGDASENKILPSLLQVGSRASSLVEMIRNRASHSDHRYSAEGSLHHNSTDREEKKSNVENGGRISTLGKTFRASMPRVFAGTRTIPERMIKPRASSIAGSTPSLNESALDAGPTSDAILIDKSGQSQEHVLNGLNQKVNI